MHKEIDVTIKGVAPLIMHNGQLADPLNEHARAMKAISGKRKKTDEDHEELARLEWMGSLYLDDDLEPCIPGELIEALIVEGSKKHRSSPQAKSGVICDGNWPLQYEGPRDPAAMWESGKFKKVAGVRVQKNRVMRCRPLFRSWSLDFTVSYAPDVLNKETVREFVETAGRLVGLCDWRPKHGRFSVESIS